MDAFFIYLSSFDPLPDKEYMFKKIDKVLAAFGNKKTDESLDAAFFEGDIATNMKGDKIATSQHGQVFVGIQDIQGYKFLEVIIISRTNIKAKRGATLIFSNTNDPFTIVSDTQEIESDFFKAVNCYMTQISFNITPKEIARIKKKDFEEIHLEYKKKALSFKKVK
jgi:hypothetical protein